MGVRSWEECLWEFVVACEVVAEELPSAEPAGGTIVAAAAALVDNAADSLHRIPKSIDAWGSLLVHQQLQQLPAVLDVEAE